MSGCEVEGRRANEDARLVVRGANSNASDSQPINESRSHHWLRRIFTPPLQSRIGVNSGTVSQFFAYTSFVDLKISDFRFQPKTFKVKQLLL